MKSIALIRHAKSSWRDASLQDFDRPFNRRGRINAAMMGERLLKQHESGLKIYSSPAMRARETASLILQPLGMLEDKIEIIPSLYTVKGEGLLVWLR